MGSCPRCIKRCLPFHTWRSRRWRPGGPTRRPAMEWRMDRGTGHRRFFCWGKRGKRMIEWNKILVQYGSVISCKKKTVDQLMSVFFTWLVLWNMFYFSIQLGIMTPIDEVIFFQRGRYTTNQLRMFHWKIPSGKLLHNYGKSPFFMGKLKTHYFDWAIFQFAM